MEAKGETTNMNSTPKTALELARQQVKSNCLNGRYAYEGMTQTAIAEYNRNLMFGDNDEGFHEAEFRAVTE